MQKEQSCSQGWGRKTPVWLESAVVASPREVWGDLVINPLCHLGRRSLQVRCSVGRAVREKSALLWQQSEGSWWKQEQQPPGYQMALGWDLTWHLGPLSVFFATVWATGIPAPWLCVRPWGLDHSFPPSSSLPAVFNIKSMELFSPPYFLIQQDNTMYVFIS